jgi:hypothetical protein
MQVSPKRTAGATFGGRGRDAILRRITGDGRIVTFLATDLIPGRPLRLWGALAETAGSAAGGGVFIRLGVLGAHDGWSVTQLLAVALARFEAELARAGSAEVAEIVRSLELAAAEYREPQEGEPVLPVSFEPDAAGAASLYPWVLARAGLFVIPLCPDPEGQGGGITSAQLLAVLDLAMTAWLPVTPWRSCWQAWRAVREALAVEAGRMVDREVAATATPTTPGAEATPPGRM